MKQINIPILKIPILLDSNDSLKYNRKKWFKDKL